jgi:hypothetical protein
VKTDEPAWPVGSNQVASSWGWFLSFARTSASWISPELTARIMLSEVAHQWPMQGWNEID